MDTPKSGNELNTIYVIMAHKLRPPFIFDPTDVSAARLTRVSRTLGRAARHHPGLADLVRRREEGRGG